MLRFTLSAALFVACSLATECLLSQEQARTWTDATGQFKVEAILLRVEGEKAFLQRQSDDRVLQIPLARLSQADRDFIAANRPQNPFLFPDEKLTSPKPVVVVRFRTSGSDIPVTGVVVHREGKQALIACRTMRIEPSDFEKLTIELMWRDGRDWKTVRGQLVAPYDRLSSRTVMLVSAPADELPASLEPKQVEVVFPQQVQLIGYNFTQDAPEKAELHMSQGTLQATVHPHGWRLEAKDAANDSLILLPDGTPVGSFVSMSPVAAGRTAQGSALQYAELVKALDPQLVRAEVVPIEGDKKQITYAVVTYIADPLSRARDIKVLVRSVDRRGANAHGVLERPSDGVWQAISDAANLEIAPETAPEKLTSQAPAVKFFSGVKAYSGRFTKPNPGPINRHEFAVQIAYTDAAGKEVFLQPDYATYDVKKAINVPAIPGLNLRPLDMPQPVEVEGGWQLTSDVTRIGDEENKPFDSPPFPRPEPGDKTAIKACKARNGTFGGNFASFSPDGAWLFLIDNSTTLRKYDAATMEEVAQIRLSAECIDVGFSKAGLMLAATGIDLIWVLDPEMLSLRQEIHVPNLRIVAGSPQSDIGVALGRSPGESRGIANHSLYIVNFRTGKKIHRIGEFSRQYRLNDTTDWPITLFWKLRMSPDAKYIYALDDRPKRFRLDGEDLIFEEDGKEIANASSARRSLELSRDGSLVVMPGFVFKHDKLSTPYMAISDTGISGIDPVNGNIYAIGNSGLTVFDERGSKVRNEPKGPSYPGAVVVHPGGGRIVTWSGSGAFYYYDLRK